MKRAPRFSWAYRLRGEVSILPRCSSLASLLRQMPEGAEPGKWDDEAGVFVPLAGRA